MLAASPPAEKIERRLRAAFHFTGTGYRSDESSALRRIGTRCLVWSDGQPAWLALDRETACDTELPTVIRACV